MQMASAGHRDSPVTRTNSSRTAVLLTAATSPIANVNRWFSGTVGPVGLFSSQPVTQRRQINRLAARMMGHLAKNVPVTPSEFIDKREGGRAVAKALADIEAEHALQSRQADSQSSSHVDVVSAAAGRLTTYTRDVDEHGSADVNRRPYTPPLPSLTREIRDLATQSIGLQ